MATRTGTWGYRDRFGDAFARTYFRRFGPGVVSSIGIGTYLGDPTDEVDDRYERAIVTALENGINVVDTAINYRCQRSERVVGRAIRNASVDREAVLVSTKGGFLPFDGSRPDDPGRYLGREFIESGIVEPADLAMGSHCLTPGYIDESLDRSLENLGVETIDLYYVHNPETQLRERSRAEVYDRLEDTFVRLEERRLAEDIGRYGVATWEAFRVSRNHENFLSLPTILDRSRAAAETVGAESAGLQAIQLPFNVHMADAFTVENQAVDDDTAPVSTLEYAHEAGLGVFTSASLAQGELTTGIPQDIEAELEGDSPSQRAINFARSAPGVTCALVGASTPAHVRENVAAGTFEPLGAGAFDTVFE